MVSPAGQLLQVEPPLARRRDAGCGSITAAPHAGSSACTPGRRMGRGWLAGLTALGLHLGLLHGFGLATATTSGIVAPVAAPARPVLIVSLLPAQSTAIATPNAPASAPASTSASAPATPLATALQPAAPDSAVPTSTPAPSSTADKQSSQGAPVAADASAASASVHQAVSPQGRDEGSTAAMAAVLEIGAKASQGPGTASALAVPAPFAENDPSRKTPNVITEALVDHATAPPPASVAAAAREARPYFKTSQLSVKPALLQDIPAVLRLTVPGLVSQPVILRLLINEQGGVDQAELVDAALPAPAQQALADAFSALRFAPGQRAGQAVRSQLRIEVLLENKAQVQVVDLGGK
ncbi:MAG: hypothetical protein ACRYGK_15430 [Janthinobacterium lividum]